jgi:hypothetical protein
MISRYKIKNTGRFSNFGYNGRLPDATQEIIDYQQYIPHIILKQPSWSKILMKRFYKYLTTRAIKR